MKSGEDGSYRTAQVSHGDGRRKKSKTEEYEELDWNICQITQSIYLTEQKFILDCRYRVIESSSLVPILFREVFSHPYISFFHLLVNGFSVTCIPNNLYLILIVAF